ncbi:MAG TPA: bifunctional lysylphosphatidylglycerol flippase/synthetase MprF, partial [Opitutus sp.]|nr:bifunctional lysylphosphatidylglycerol flippase/synthetase MprF [Opitutus sp.]
MTFAEWLKHKGLRLPPGIPNSERTAAASCPDGLALRARTWLGPLASVAFFSLAVWVLRDALRHEHYTSVVHAVDSVPGNAILLAAALTVFGYGILSLFDLLGFRFIGRRLPMRQIVTTSFLGYALGNNVGNTLIAGGTVRFWIYSSLGIPAADIARVTVFCTLGFLLGCTWLGALAFAIEPIALPASLHLPFATTRPIGLVLFAVLSLYVGWVATKTARIRFGRWQVDLPSLPLTTAQLVVATLDLAAMSGALWVLLPPVPYLQFLSVFMLALIVGVTSQVPGGLGVFETTVLVLLRDRLPTQRILAGLVVFRAIYYVAPLLIATGLVAYRAARRRTRIFSRPVVRGIQIAVPQFLAVATFAAGAILLFSGALPATTGRLAHLTHLLPLSLVEASHFLASLVGMALLLVARGLQRRVREAVAVALALLGAGIAVSLAKGFDYEEASLLALAFVALAACRKRFYRPASLFTIPLSRGWIAATFIVIAASLELYFFAFKHVEYSRELWWQFAFNAEAPRALRATVAAAVMGAFFGAAILLRPKPPAPKLADAADIERARKIVRQSPSTHGNLALRGDKTLLFSESGNAFLMYGHQGRSWIAMGDPVGSRQEARELLWVFCELCDRFGGRPVVFEAREEWLPVYRELGLAVTPLGEEARIDLPKFSLESAAHKSLRRTCSRLPRLGCTFEILPREAVPGILPELADISDAWLEEKTTREKGFSNGSFDRAYLREFPLAVVRQNGKTLAFANLWCGAGKEELSIDLMRHLPSAPNGTMDFLFAKLLLWGRHEGYRWFNLGMAPLAGLDAHTEGV